MYVVDRDDTAEDASTDAPALTWETTGETFLNLCEIPKAGARQTQVYLIRTSNNPFCPTKAEIAPEPNIRWPKSMPLLDLIQHQGRLGHSAVIPTFPFGGMMHVLLVSVNVRIPLKPFTAPLLALPSLAEDTSFILVRWDDTEGTEYAIHVPPRDYQHLRRMLYHTALMDVENDVLYYFPEDRIELDARNRIAITEESFADWIMMKTLFGALTRIWVYPKMDGRSPVGETA
jgi:hypothetical protein